MPGPKTKDGFEVGLDGKIRLKTPATDVVMPKRRVGKMLKRQEDHLAMSEDQLVRITQQRDDALIRRDELKAVHDAAADDPTPALPADPGPPA